MLFKAICYRKLNETRSMAKVNSKNIRLFIFIYMSFSWNLHLAIREHTQQNHDKVPRRTWDPLFAGTSKET